jgi:tRNA(fMet)-specific endonuclease VapC
LGQLAISSITASELAFGVEKSGSERNKQALNKFLAPLEICPYNDQAIWHYAQLRHALALDAVLVTNNLKEFERVARLRLENWV